MVKRALVTTAEVVFVLTITALASIVTASAILWWSTADIIKEIRTGKR